MATPLEFGAVREVWLATLAAPTTYYSFLARDDAFNKTGVSFGRSTRIDKPLNLGFGSGWQQLSWEGGRNQLTWRDEQMFAEGNADPYSAAGKLRLWPGWEAIKKEPLREFHGYCMSRGGKGLSLGDNILYFGENNFWSGTGTVAPTGGFRPYQFNPRTGQCERIPFNGSSGIHAQLGVTGFTSVVAATDDASSEEYVYFGTATGLFLWHYTGRTWFRDTNAPATGVGWNSMLPYKDALYYCSGKAFYKRTPLAPYGTLGTHTKVKEHKASFRTIGLEVWQNRLWYGVQYSANRTSIVTSDGVTANEAFQMPDEFFITGLKAHQGALYIFGGKSQLYPGGSGTSNTYGPPTSIGQVWKYTGGVPTLLWESNDENRSADKDRKSHIVYPGCSWGELLVWGHAGFQGTVEERPGLMCYHPQTDALFNGPELQMDPSGVKQGMLVTGVTSWRNSVVCAFRDMKSYMGGTSHKVDHPKGILALRTPDYYRDSPNWKDKTVLQGRSIEHAPLIRYAWVKSSVYHGSDDTANETKTWLSGRVNVKLPSSKCRIKVWALTKEGYWSPPGHDTSPQGVDYDGSPNNVRTNAAGRPEALATATLVKTITYTSSNKDWRVVTFPLKDDNGAYLSSQKLQYAIELENVGGGNTSNATPEVDSVEIQYVLAPTKRRQWRVRFVLTDAQTRLDGNANSLTTAQAMADKLELFWSSSIPFNLYEPTTATGSSPAGSPIEVVPVTEGYSVQQYRLGTDETGVAQEVSMTLIENITS